MLAAPTAVLFTAALLRFRLLCARRGWIPRSCCEIDSMRATLAQDPKLMLSAVGCEMPIASGDTRRLLPRPMHSPTQ